MSNQELDLVVNNRIFIGSVLSLSESLKLKTDELLNNPPSNLHLDSFKKFNQTLTDIITEYKDNKTGISGVDQSRIIKKVYSTVKDDVKLLKEKNNALFNKKTQEGKIMSIIPGLNLALVIPYLDENETNSFWSHLQMMFCACARMIFISNKKEKEKEKNKELLSTISELERELGKNGGVVMRGLNFNPYLGVQVESEKANLSVDSILSDADKIKVNSAMSTEGMLSMLGIDMKDMLDENKLLQSLENIDETQMNLASDQIAELLGAKGDEDVKEMTSTLVKNIVGELKEKGLSDFMNIAQSVTDKLQHDKTFNRARMQKTADKMRNMMGDPSKLTQKLNETIASLKEKEGDKMQNFPIPLDMLAKFGGMLGNTKNDKDTKDDKSKKSKK